MPTLDGSTVTVVADVSDVVVEVALVADGGVGGGSVDSVTAGDSSITVGGTATDPTVKVAANGITAAKIASGTITDTQVAAANKDGAAATPSLRTLGTGSTQAAAGNDARLSDARAPSGTAGGDLAGTYPNPTLAAVGSAAGPIGDSTHTPVVTIDAKGRVTALTSAAISPGGGAGYPQTAIDVFVDYTNGSDTNNGLSPSTPYKTIQFAYDTLKSYVAANYSTPARNDIGIGRINLLPGGHFIGNGLNFVPHSPVEIVGALGGLRNHQAAGSTAFIATGTGLGAGSSTATEFIKISNSTDIGHGFIIRDVAFLIDQTNCTSLTAVIRTVNVDHLVVQNCMCSTEDATTNMSVYFISQESITNGDNAWARIEENFVSRVALWHGTGAGGNINRATYRGNVVFYGGSLPMFNIDSNMSSCSIDNNNFEGASTAIQQTSGTCKGCVFINNGGEGAGVASDATVPYYNFTGSANLNTIIGGEVTLAGGTNNGIYCQFGTSAYNNIVIGPFDTTGTAGFKRRIVDSSTYGNRIVDHRFGVVTKLKTGTAPTISDSDFGSTPPDGTTALTYGSTGPVYKLWGRLNGTWKSVALT